MTLTATARRFSALERALRLATDQAAEETIPDLVVAPAPDLLKYVSRRRPRDASELRTRAGREAQRWLQGALEPVVVSAVAASRQARETASRNENLSAAGKAQHLAQLVGACYASLREPASFVLGSARQAARIEGQMLGAARVREGKLSSWETASTLDARQQLLAMSESERNKCLVRALQDGDLVVLHAALSQPLSLGDACGTLVGLTTRDKIEETYVRALLPERARDLDEVRQVTQAAADALQYCIHLMQRETATRAPEFLQVPLACLTEAKFCTFSTAELDAMHVAATAAGESTRDYLHRRATELGHLQPEPATA